MIFKTKSIYYFSIYILYLYNILSFYFIIKLILGKIIKYYLNYNFESTSLILSILIIRKILIFIRKI